MAWTADDAVRSVRRYAAEVLGDPWQIHLAREEIADEDRPAAFITHGELTTRGRAAAEQGEVTYALPLTLTAYPPVAPIRWSAAAARETEQLLADLILIGLPDSRPFRVPLYDFAGVPVVGEDREGPTEPHDWMWVEDHSVVAAQDPADLGRWAVALDLRVTWEAPGRIIPRETVSDLRGTYVPP